MKSFRGLAGLGLSTESIVIPTYISICKSSLDDDGKWHLVESNKTTYSCSTLKKPFCNHSNVDLNSKNCSKNCISKSDIRQQVAKLQDEGELICADCVKTLYGDSQ